MAFEPTTSAVDSPIWGKVFAAVLGGAGVLGVVYVLMTLRPSQNALLILAAGLVAVALLLALYRLFLKWLRKRKAAPMTRSILANSSAAPHGISDPARRAKLDEMRKSFESGVAKFKAAGKDLYTLPWFVLVGEPGGGKTEAIRHSQVGFPHGLQDYMQGAGGTVNMNWWFTNHAIILDTAGRLMFEEVAPGTTNEWGEFLSLLRQNRPNCPINGMVLVIPADTLIKDGTEAIERKAGKIAQQLDLIQRTLEVRFPVFVLISKCDLVSGFREFFETLDDPQLQGQILGWSNPASLDQPFNPEVVDRHLETVRQRLAARRYGLLLDPVHTEDPHARRIDQVDALFTFPDSLGRIAPRLRRYLEMIFVAGEWSPKPLFLRGIYFTSSMREGAALDAELAEVLKVPVDSLQDEGRSWERNKTYFLREPFLKKIFAEKGLVTRAARPNRVHRTRKIAVLVAGFVAIGALFGLTAVGVREFNANIGHEKSFWEKVERGHRSWSIIDKDGGYAADYPKVVDGMPLPQLIASARGAVDRKIEVPKVFAPSHVVSNDFSPEKRKQAFRAVYETTVLAPLVQHARRKLAETGPDEWDADATAALKELVRLEAQARAGTAPPAGGAARSPIDLDPLFKFVLNDGNFKAYQAQQDKEKGRRRDLEGTAAWFYAGGKEAWPPPALRLQQPESVGAIEAGIANFKKHWEEYVGKKDPTLLAADRLKAALAAYRDAVAAGEADAVAATKRPVATTQEYEAFRQVLADRVKDLEEKSAAVESARKDVETAEREAGRDPSSAAVSVARAYKAGGEQLEQRAAAAYDQLRDAVGQDDSGDVLATLGDAPRRRIDDKQQAEFAAVDADLKPAPGLPGVPSYAAAEHVYREAVAELERAGKGAVANTDAPQLAKVLLRIDEEAKKQAGAVVLVGQQLQGARLNAQAACDAWKAAAEAAAAHRRHAALAQVLNSLAGASAADQVAGLAEKAVRHHPSTIPLTWVDRKSPFEKKYDPAAVKTFLARIEALRGMLAAEPSAGGDGAAGAPRVLNIEDLQARYAQKREGVAKYMAEYVGYWASEVPQLATLKKGELETWAGFEADAQGAKRNWRSDSINAALEQFAGTIVEALDVAAGAELAGRARQTAEDHARDMRAVLNHIKTRAFNEATARVLESWKRPRGDAAAARRLILDEEPNRFLTNYIFDDPDAGFAGDYWEQVSNRLLEVLVADRVRAAESAYAKAIAPFDAFPLTLVPRRELTVKQLEQAKASVDAFQDNVGPGQAAAGKIRGGTLPDFPGAPLLRQLLAPMGDPRRFDSIQRVVDALGGQRPATCTLQLMDAKPRDQRRAQHRGPERAEMRFSDVRVEQKGGPAGPQLRADPTANRDNTLGQFRCVSETPIELLLLKGVAGREVSRVTFPSPWTGPRMLLTRAADPRSPVRQAILRDTKKENGETRQTWDVEVEVVDTADKQAFSVWLVVVFDREFPRPEDWSQPFVQAPGR